MTPLAKKLLVVLAGVLVMTAAMVLTIQWGGPEKPPGVTLEFEMMDPKADAAVELSVVRTRLAGMGAVASKSGAARIAVWIPYSPELQTTYAKLQETLEEFRKTELSPARVEGLVKADAAERDPEMRRLAPAGSALHEDLRLLAEAADRYTAAHTRAATYPAGSAPADVLGAPLLAAQEVDAARALVFAKVLNVARLKALVQAADDPNDAAAQLRRDELVVLYPAQATEILHVTAAYAAWRAAGGGRHRGPEDVEARLLTGGVLEFRIVVLAAEIGGTQSADYRQVMDSLQKRGPNVLMRAGTGDMRWCELYPEFRAAGEAGDFVTGYAEGKEYLLCYEGHERTLTHLDPTRKAWSVRVGPPLLAEGGMQMTFAMDAVGGGYLGELTSLYKGHALAMLMDNRVLSMPVVMMPMKETGILELSGSAGESAAKVRKDAEEVHAMLQLPALPSALRRVR